LDETMVKTRNCLAFPERRRRHIVTILTVHLFLSLAAAGPVLLTSQQAQAAGKRTDKREIEARQAFAAGRYQEALDLYAALYADKVHPTYLRNVGRCYQNLKQPDQAINSFRDYLRQAKNLKASERAEIEGYIAEMEELKRSQEEEEAAKAKAAAAAAQPASPTPPTPVPSPVVSDSAAVAPAGGLQLDHQAPAAPPEQTPVYKKAWFWTVVGVAVAGAVVGGLYVGGVFSNSSIDCTASGGCQ
jgi:tetratricopeptide (TPR) repeat protein